MVIVVKIELMVKVRLVNVIFLIVGQNFFLVDFFLLLL